MAHKKVFHRRRQPGGVVTVVRWWLSGWRRQASGFKSVANSTSSLWELSASRHLCIRYMYTIAPQVAQKTRYCSSMAIVVTSATAMCSLP